jgi:outer membrane protein OmpA-like peptidoglycan-associated protein
MSKTNIILSGILSIIVCFFSFIQTKAQNSKDHGDFGKIDEHLNNFIGRIYFIPENTIKLPDFSKLDPVGEIFTDCLNVEYRDFQKGFPGVTNRFEFFAIDYKGYFYSKESGFYTFSLSSDDGSKLFVDHKLVIDNDSLHDLRGKVNSIKLGKGNHELEVQYFQGPRFSVALVLRFKKISEKTYQIFNLTKFYPISLNENDSTIDVSIGNEILFDFNSYELSKIAKRALTDIKRIIIDKTRLKSIIVEGHTDDIGSESYNMKLSVNRANAVKIFLTDLGVDSTNIIIKGYGKTKPKVPNVDNESRKINRRIEMSILKVNDYR